MRWRVLSIIGILYAVQFIPLFFAVMALPVILRQEGHSATTIGLVQIAAIPYVFKFIWAPLIDKYSLGADRYKSWIVVLSTAHVLALIGLAFMDPSGPLIPLFVVLLLAITAVSTQDIAVDALAISLMRPSERSLGATFQNAGAYGGAIVGGFVFLYFYGTIGWKAAILIQATVFALPLFSLLLVNEPKRLRGAPPVTFHNALRFFLQPKMGRWLAVLGTMRMPILVTMLPMRLMMVDQGMSTEEIAVWFGLFAMSAGGGSTVLFGPLLRNLPRVRAIYIVGLLNIPVLVGVAYIAAAFPDGIRYAIILGWVAIALTDIVMFRAAMDKIRPEMPGFDFSAQIAVYMLLPGLMDPIAGVVIDAYGVLPVFLAAIPLAFIPLAILRFFVAPIRKSNRGLDGERSVSTGIAQSTDPHALLDHLDKVFTEHGITCTRLKPDFLRMEEMGCLVDVKAEANAIDVLIDTPTENFLLFIRDELIEEIDNFDAETAKDLRWTGAIRVGEMPSNFRVLRAKSRREVFPGLIRVTLEGIDVQALTKDGIHLKLMMPQERGRKPVWPVIGENGGIAWPDGRDKLHARWVTIHDIRIDEREIDVDVANHDGGLISDWAALEGDEQEVGVIGPGGDARLEQTKNVILAADFTGLPAVARLIDSVGGNVTGHVVAAAPSQDALVAYLPKSKMTLTAVDPKEFNEKVASIVKNCTSETVTFGWFAGEFSAAQKVRRVFKSDLGLSRKGSQLSVAYWRYGAPGYAAKAS